MKNGTKKKNNTPLRGVIFMAALVAAMLNPSAGKAESAKTQANKACRRIKTTSCKEACKKRRKGAYEKIVATCHASKEAAEAYAKGVEAFSKADYKSAFEAFKRSYDLSQKADLLFNMGRCKELLGEHAEAISLFEEYLKSGPTDAETIKTMIVNLRKLVEAAKPPPPPEVIKPKVAEKPRPKAGPKVAPKPLPAVAVPPGKGRALRAAGWSAVGVGIASLIAGAVLTGVAADKANNIEDWLRNGGAYTPAVEEDEALQQRLQAAGIATLAAGGAVAITGAVLLLLDARNERAAKKAAAWLPKFSPAASGGTLNWGFSF